MSEQNLDTDLKAIVGAVTFIGYKKEFVQKCAIDMKNNGRLLSSESLLTECELQSPSESLYIIDDSLDRIDSGVGFFEPDVESTETSSAATRDSFAYSHLVTSHLSLPSTSSADTNSSLESALSSSSTISRPFTTSFQSYTHENAASSPETYFSATSSLNNSLQDAGEDSIDGAHFESVGDYSNVGLDGWPSSNIPTFTFSPNEGIDNLQTFNADPDDGFEDWSQNNLSTITNNASCSVPMLTGISSDHILFTEFSHDKPSVASLTTSQSFSTVCEKSDSVVASSGASVLPVGGPHDIQSLYKASTSPLRDKRTSTDLQDVVCDGAAINTFQEINKDVKIEATFQKQAHQETPGSSKIRSFSFKEAEFKNICLKLVEKEHTLLEKSRLCSNCLLMPRDTTFLPCGHFATCKNCAEPIYACPQCNENILATVLTYLS